MTSPSVTEPGNVAQLASWVSGETGGDLFSIQVKEPYPSDWAGCLERANQEKKNDTHPALRNVLENIEEYDTIYLGYPKLACIPQFDTMHPSMSLGASFNDRNFRYFSLVPNCN